VDNGAGGAMRRPPRGFLFPIARESLSSMRLFFGHPERRLAGVERSLAVLRA
jgi:hypothetical protein